MCNSNSMWGPDELHALQNICMRLFAAERSGVPQLHVPDGSSEYAPLFFFRDLDGGHWTTINRSVTGGSTLI